MAAALVWCSTSSSAACARSSGRAGVPPAAARPVHGAVTELAEARQKHVYVVEQPEVAPGAEAPSIDRGPPRGHRTSPRHAGATQAKRKQSQQPAPRPRLSCDPRAGSSAALGGAQREQRRQRARMG
eukprot:gene18332-biopygen14478